MAEFPNLPDDIYQYQNQFNYSVWTPDTVVTCCNVPWDGSYRDIVRFDSDQAREEYFSSLAGYSFRVNGMVYLRYNDPIRVNIPFHEVNSCNYIIVKNKLQPVPNATQPDTFYYFIKDVQYIAPNTTQLNVQLDIWQTYYNRVSFNYCYVNKGHIGIANSNSDLTNLRSYLTDTEGMNIGDEYDIVHQEFVSYQGEQPLVVIVSSTSLTSDWGDVSNPHLNTSSGSRNDGMPSGSDVWACTSSDFLKLMDALSDAPWVSQGISLVTIVPAKFANISDSESVNVHGATLFRILYTSDIIEYDIIDQVWDKFDIPERYKNLYKFYTSPYTCIEMTALNGGELVLKPECLEVTRLADNYGDTHENAIYLQYDVCMCPPQIRILATINNYNGYGSQNQIINFFDALGEYRSTTLRSGEGFDMSLILDSFPQIPIVNNMYQYYLASTVNSRNYSFAAADWSQQKALTAASLSYNQASANMENALANQQVANQANWALSGISQEKNLWNGVQGAASSAVGALGNVGSGNVGGALANSANVLGNVVNTGLNADWINRTTATQVGAATQSTLNNVANQGYMRDTNYDYANFAAQGDYETAIQGIQAKVQDAKLTQPSTSGQNGGDAFNLSNGFCGVLFKWKRLKSNFMVQIGEFWLRYGYYVNRWIIPPADLKCMSKFTYWKMQYVSLDSSPMPEVFKEGIRGIFEKGVTVWNNPNEMNKIDFGDNKPIDGVRY